MVSTVAEFGDDTKELRTLRHTHIAHTPSIKHESRYCGEGILPCM